jgi:hypothetical protein
MKFAAQKAMTARTPASAIRRSRAVDGGRSTTDDGGRSVPRAAVLAEDEVTPAGGPAGVGPDSGIGGLSI